MISKAVQQWTSLAVLFLLPACAPSYGLYLQYDSQFIQSDLDRILKENPLGPAENIKVVTLGKGQTVSHHIVQIRDREVPHIHKRHDLTVTVLRGQGYLVLGQSKLDLSIADTVFIPRDVVHYFVNQSREPAVAFVTFSPPFDGKDTIPVAVPQSPS